MPRLSSGREWIRAAKVIGQRIPLMVNKQFGKHSRGERQSMSFRMANGEQGADILPRKEVFGDLVTELGYLAPRSVVIPAHSTSNQIAQVVTEGLPDEARYFAKPVNGVQGEGAHLYERLDDVARAVEGQSEDYLVQSDETPIEDWRYIWQRDSDDEEKVWRIGYKKVRPIVVGDGHSTIEQLVDQASTIPADRKTGVIQKIGERSLRIPLDGIETPVAESGNISNGAYGQLPDEKELGRMDTFMKQFIGDVEEKLGTKFNTQCFDLGVKDRSVFEGEYDFEKMKQTIVFYEFQIPFGITGYLDELYGRDGKPLERVRNLTRRLQMQARVRQAMLKGVMANTTE